MWARPDPAARNSIRISHGCCLPRQVSRELDRKQSGKDSLSGTGCWCCKSWLNVLLHAGALNLTLWKSVSFIKSLAYFWHTWNSLRLLSDCLYLLCLAFFFLTLLWLSCLYYIYTLMMYIFNAVLNMLQSLSIARFRNLMCFRSICNICFHFSGFPKFFSWKCS